MDAEKQNNATKKTTAVAAAEHYITREQALNVALNIGKVLLKSGAETSRVEDTIARFCRSFGYHDVNVFATPTMIIIGDETTANASLMCRIRYRSNNLSNVKAINDFSYGLKPESFNYDEAMAFLHHLLQKEPPYGKWTVCLASAICSAAFASMLGGNSHDFFAAFVTGGLAMTLLCQLTSYSLGAFWENTVAGAAIGALAIMCCAVSVQCTRTNIIVGSLMPFLPGLAFTNGLRDYLSGDLISGNSRIAEALLFAVSIAFGLAFTLLIWYRWGVGTMAISKVKEAATVGTMAISKVKEAATVGTMAISSLILFPNFPDEGRWQA